MNEFFLRSGYPVLLALILIASAALAAAGARGLARAIKPRLSRFGLAGLSLIVLGSLWLRLTVLPPSHQVYWDEFLDIDVAANIARYGRFGESLANGTGAPPIFHAPSRPGGYHLLLAAADLSFGGGERTAAALSVALSAASVVLIFLAALLLFEDEASGLLAAALLAVLPTHVRFAGSAELTACSAFWLLATIAALALWTRTNARRHFWLALACGLYAANTRYENALLAAPLALAVLPRKGEAKDGVLAAFAAYLVLLTPAFALAMHNRAAGLLGFSDSPGQSLTHFLAHAPGNLRFFVSNPAWALLLLPAAALCWARAESERRPRLLFLAALAAAYAAVGSAHAMGDFNDPPFERLALPTELCLILAAAAGWSGLLAGTRRAAAGAAVVAAFAALSLPGYLKGPNPAAVREYEFIRDSVSSLPRDGVVITVCAPVILSAGRPALAATLFWNDGATALDALRRGGARPLILFKDLLWDRFPAESSRLEARLEARYRLVSLKTLKIDGRDYGFYRLEPRASY
jgi:4-amino-4-deoxy-L-arabinose transferase-like glycosyltransferase